MTEILVIDDESDILELTKVMLTSSGYLVKTATSCEEATRMIAESKPDLMLLDVILPGASGLELCRRLKRDPETRGIRVVIFTALGSGVDLMLAKGEKADGYLEKPFTRSMLLEKVARLLGTSASDPRPLIPSL